jgi:hypothetical protein
LSGFFQGEQPVFKGGRASRKSVYTLKLKTFKTTFTDCAKIFKEGK